MANKVVYLESVVEGVKVPVTTGTFYLRKYPYSVNYTTGETPDANGMCLFEDLEDGRYRPYNSSGSPISLDDIWVGDENINLSGLSITGNGVDDNICISASQIQIYANCSTNFHSSDIAHVDNLQLASMSENLAGYGISANNKVIFCGDCVNDTVEFKNAQVQFDNNTSTNFNSGDIAHVDNLQVASLSENVAGAGIRFNSPVTSMTAANFVATGEMKATNVRIGDANLDPYSQNYNHIYNITNFHQVAPFADSDPTFSNQLSRKSYVDAKYNSIVSPLSSYNQSYQIIRLQYNGINETNKVVTSITGAMNISLTAGSAPSSANQKCVLIENIGTSNLIQDWIHSPGNGRNLFTNWVHVKALTPNIKVNAYTFSATITASEISAIIYENIDFYGIGDSGATFEKIVFKNCTFESANDGYGDFIYDFSYCNFVGGNYFKGYRPNLVECTGERIYSENIPNTSGTNKIKYETPNLIILGTKTFSDNSTALELQSLSAKGIVSASAMSINSTSLTGNGSELYVGGTLKTAAGAVIGGETTIDGRLKVNGDAYINSTNISLTGAITWNHTPNPGTLTPDKTIEIKLSDGKTYLIAVQEKV